ncbi:hypothetical protein M758_6G109700 [Ceratodon purpureus]|nr:hypothetical protein M758_6G109700 [Ceratodon purpureus]
MNHPIANLFNKTTSAATKLPTQFYNVLNELQAAKNLCFIGTYQALDGMQSLWIRCRQLSLEIGNKLPPDRSLCRHFSGAERLHHLPVSLSPFLIEDCVP